MQGEKYLGDSQVLWHRGLMYDRVHKAYVSIRLTLSVTQTNGELMPLKADGLCINWPAAPETLADQLTHSVVMSDLAARAVLTAC